MAMETSRHQVTISGHGNPSTLVLGDDRILSSELRSSGYSDTKALLKELKPALIHAGGARESRSHGGFHSHGGSPKAGWFDNGKVHFFDGRFGGYPLVN